MKHIQTIETRNLCQSAKNGGCGGARPPASLLARPAAASPTRSARTRISNLIFRKCRLFGRHFSCARRKI